MGWFPFFSFLFLLQSYVNAICVTQRPSSIHLLCPFIAAMTKTHGFERFWTLERLSGEDLFQHRRDIPAAPAE